MKRRNLAICLIIVLLGPSLGTFGWLHYQKYAVRAEVKKMMINNGMAEEHLVLLQFSAEEKAGLKWEHDKEFEYQGQMYDVVDSYQVGDIFYYSCWPDHEESLINKNLSALTKGILDDDPDRQKQQVSLIHFFKTLYFQNIEKLKFGITAVRPSESFYCFNLSSLYYPP